ncbi:hypothetical protein C2845_PM13G10900 [Panicum miliaceum]|uniref:F-box domain-containing protein n=1 Tax=Panicum miliaceum TaxID=4540 RepID=A0A3L6RH85_PANMI|nr:hypothetical protein C2845_PM13G10900 [Panicum miliaceum]
MAPLNPNTTKKKATDTPSSAKRGAAKRVLKNPTRGVTGSSRTADEGDLQDRISALPEDMLCCILTLLSVHDSARTTVLSKLWQHLFKSMWEWCCPGITSALIASLARPHSPIRRFIIQETLPWDSELSLWLEMLSQGGVVEEIVLEMPYLQVCLPHFIFNCNSLRSLNLSCLRWPLIDGPNGVPAGYVPSWTLSFLTELTLSYMDMTTRDTEDLVRRCPVLLSLSICYSIHVHDRSLTIRCENLLSLTIQDNASRYDEFSIMHAPKLERLLLVLDPLCLSGTRLEAFPRLHTLGIFKKYELQVALGQMVEGWSDGTKSKLTSFKKMAGGPIECLESSLKMLAFTNFLLGAAKVLKSMLICNKTMGGKLLRQERRGSSSAQIVFLENNNCDIKISISASNYKLADPFMP